MWMVRPLPDADFVHCARSGHGPQTSGSKWTVLPGSKCSTGSVRFFGAP